MGYIEEKKFKNPPEIRAAMAQVQREYHTRKKATEKPSENLTLEQRIEQLKHLNGPEYHCKMKQKLKPT